MNKLTFVKSILTFCLFLVSMTAATAFENIKLVPNTKQKTFTLFVGNLSAMPLSVKISDRYTVSVFTERVMAEANYAKRYNLSSLPAGTYEVKVSTPTRTIRQNIEITNTGLVLTDEKVDVDYKPVIQLEGKRLDVNLLSKGEKVKLAILNRNNELVYDLDLGRPMRIHQRFDLSQLPAEDIILKIKCGKQTYYEHLTL